jgi:hypothetical protein
MLERPVTELCLRADDAYRKTAKRSGGRNGDQPSRSDATVERHTYGLALQAAAMKSGEYASFKKIVEGLKADSPEVASALGL